MKKIIAKFIVAIIVSVLFGMTTASCVKRVEKSTEIPSDGKLKLVSMAPNITQIVFALGAGDMLIGVDDYSVYPPEAKSIPRMGSLMKPNLELLAKLKPDLVLVVNTDENLIRMLDDMGIKHLEFGHNTTAEVIDCLGRLGDKLNRKARADAIIVNFNDAVDEIKAKLGNGKSTSVALVVGRTPGKLEDIIFAGPGSFLDELISLSGGVNVFSDAKIQWPQAGIESVVSKDPDVIIDSSRMEGMTDSDFTAMREEWNRIPNLKAVKADRIIIAREGWFQVPGATMDSTVRLFAHWLHPDIFTGDIPDPNPDLIYKYETIE